MPGPQKLAKRDRLLFLKRHVTFLILIREIPCLLLGDEKQGIAIVKNEVFTHFAETILKAQLSETNEDEEND